MSHGALDAEVTTFRDVENYLKGNLSISARRMEDSLDHFIEVELKLGAETFSSVKINLPRTLQGD